MATIQVDEEITFKMQDVNEALEQVTRDDKQVLPVNPNSITSEASQATGEDVVSPQSISTPSLPVRQRPSMENNYSLPMEIGLPQMVRNRLTMRPDKYDGQGDWEDYLTHFNTCAKLGGWDQVTKANMLAVSLSGRARRFFAGIPPPHQENYNKIVEALSARFGCEVQIEKHKAQLAMRKRTQGESAAELGDEIWRLVLRAYPKFDLKTQEQLALDAFQNAITVSLKVKCVEQACKNVEDAVRIVERYEALMHEENDRRKPVRALTSEESELSKVLAGLNQVLARLSDKGAPTENQNAKSNQTKMGQGYSRDKPRQVCWYCEKPGHMQAECYTRKRDEEKGKNKFNFQNNEVSKPGRSGNFNPSSQ